jgi:hypothetical protein
VAIVRPSADSDIVGRAGQDWTVVIDPAGVEKIRFLDKLKTQGRGHRPTVWAGPTAIWPVAPSPDI